MNRVLPANITIYTWGYHRQTTATLQAIQRQRSALIVDTRYVPSSRFGAWRKGHLERLFGADYVWIQEFGNLNYKADFNAPVVLNDPHAGLARIEPLVSEGRPLLLLCMCPTPNCHRANVAEYLQKARGWTIEHLPGRGMVPESR